MKKICLFILVVLFPLSLSAHIHGLVLDDKGNALPGANVWWMNTTMGGVTDADGHFEIEPTHATRRLITSFMGYVSDTTEVHGETSLTIVLVEDLQLDEVTISERKAAVLRSRVATLNTTTLTNEELCKAACCNLAGSFETSAAVDVAYADAATGAKQIRLLGLNGTYVQLLTENTPNVRGLAQSFGMEYIPAAWMDAIQVSKGTSSVRNGYESVTGQINVEYLKPQTTSPLSIDAIVMDKLETEVDVTGGWKVSDICHTAVLAHVRNTSMEMDHNHDGFLDMPINSNLNVMNRWYFKSGQYGGQILVRGIYDKRISGMSRATQHPYQIDLRTRRVDGFAKFGYHMDEDLGRSLGIIASASYHSQTNIYGSREWDAAQTNAYLNAIFQTNFENPQLDPEDKHEHTLAAGLSLNYDRYEETIALYTILQAMRPLDRQELTPGIFAEYTYSYLDVLTILAGIREDWSSQYGFFTTPRLNVRYAPFSWWTLRGSVGLGYRSPNLVADNAAFLPSSRQWNVNGSAWLPEWLTQEKALNTGATMTFYVPIASRELQLTGEYYFTKFLDGVIVDIERAGLVNVMTMKDNPALQQFAHNWQVEANMEILRGWTMTLAFRYTDTRQTTFDNAINAYQLREKPLQNRFKGIISTSYQTPKKTWQFDATMQFNGYGRMPDCFSNPDNGQYFERDGHLYHTWYPQLMAQITRYFHGGSVYVGSENMTNFTQKNPILGDRIEGTTYIDPTSAGYDAGQVWGPIKGWNLYIGVRWSLDTPEKSSEHHHAN